MYYNAYLGAETATATPVNQNDLLSRMLTVSAHTLARVMSAAAAGKSKYSAAVAADIKDVLGRFAAYYENFKKTFDQKALEEKYQYKLTTLSDTINKITAQWKIIEPWAINQESKELSSFSFADPTGKTRISATQLTALQSGQTAEKKSAMGDIPMVPIAIAAAVAYFAFKG